MATKQIPAFIELPDGRFVSWSTATHDEFMSAIDLLEHRSKALNEQARDLYFSMNQRFGPVELPSDE